jgi:hypothetical protein
MNRKFASLTANLRKAAMRALLPVQSWANNTKIANSIRFSLFSFLALWVHCAVFFYLTTVIFFGKDLGQPNQTILTSTSRRMMEVSLEVPSPPVPVVPTAQEQQQIASALQQIGMTDADAMVAPQTAQPSKQEAVINSLVDAAYRDNPSKDISSASVSPTANATSPSAEPQNAAAQKAGLLGCDSLAKKPERIIFGDDYVQITEDGNPPGHAIVHEVINREGAVIAVNIEESTMSKTLENQVIAWAYRKFYRPGEMGGVKVECEMKYLVSSNANR